MQEFFLIAPITYQLILISSTTTTTKSEYNYNFFIALLLFSDLSIELDTGWKMGKQSAQQTDNSVIVVD